MVMIDIDTIKRAAERLRESEARFEAIADSAPVLMWVHGLDGCEFVNRAYEKFAGVPAAKLQKPEGLGFRSLAFFRPEVVRYGGVLGGRDRQTEWGDVYE